MRILFALLLSLCAVQHARAWDDFGHMEVAAIAYDALTPHAKARANELLRLNPSHANWIIGVKKSEVDRAAFVRAATWADAIKNSRAGYKRDEQSAATAAQNIGYADKLMHPYWHFTDLPFSPDDTRLVQPPAPNVQTQIATFRQVLSTQGASEDVKSYDLTWLLHLVGDVHQPLHCASRFDRADPQGDRGGNEVRITGNQPPPICDDPQYCPFGPPSDLHAFMDTVLGDSYCLAEVYAAARQLPRPKKAQAAVLDEAIWVQEGLALAQSAVYVAPVGIGRGPFTLNAAYQQAALTLAQKQIALAGARLANLLNDCFDKEQASSGHRQPPAVPGQERQAAQDRVQVVR